MDQKYDFIVPHFSSFRINKLSHPSEAGRCGKETGGAQEALAGLPKKARKDT
jgi:hypothetical protein